MSFVAVAWASQQRITSNRKVVLLALAEHHDQTTGRCNPAAETIVEETDLNLKQVQSAVQWLCEKGLIGLRVRGRRPPQYDLFTHLSVQEFGAEPAPPRRPAFPEIVDLPDARNAPRADDLLREGGADHDEGAGVAAASPKAGGISLDDRLLNFHQVRALVGLSRTPIVTRIKQGKFPKPLALSPTCHRWVEREIKDWIVSSQGRRSAA